MCFLAHSFALRTRVALAHVFGAADCADGLCANSGALGTWRFITVDLASGRFAHWVTLCHALWVVTNPSTRRFALNLSHPRNVIIYISCAQYGMTVNSGVPFLLMHWSPLVTRVPQCLQSRLPGPRLLRRKATATILASLAETPSQCFEFQKEPRNLRKIRVCFGLDVPSLDCTNARSSLSGVRHPGSTADNPPVAHCLSWRENSCYAQAGVLSSMSDPGKSDFVRRSTRKRTERTVEIAGVKVLRLNTYSMESGEASVFDHEARDSKALEVDVPTPQRPYQLFLSAYFKDRKGGRGLDAAQAAWSGLADEQRQYYRDQYEEMKAEYDTARERAREERAARIAREEAAALEAAQRRAQAQPVAVRRPKKRRRVGRADGSGTARGSTSSTPMGAEGKRLAHNRTMKRRREEAAAVRSRFMALHRNVIRPFVPREVMSRLPILSSEDVSRMELEAVDPNAPPRAEQPSSVVGGSLRDYQRKGVEWLLYMYKNRTNAILADEMGLGKTLQTIAFLAALRERGLGGPHLVTVPLSVLGSWKSEFQRWCPDMRVVRLHSADKAERERLRSRLTHDLESYDVVLTTYDLIKVPEMRSTLATRVAWRCLVLDEGHKVKNYDSQISQAMRRVRAEFTLLLTGTPLQNNLLELWSMLAFLHPSTFTDQSPFQDAFELNAANLVIDRTMLDKAHYLMRPLMLRREKRNVNVKLPECVETKVLCPLSDMQQFWYKRLLLRNKELLLRAEGSIGGGGGAAAGVGDVTAYTGTESDTGGDWKKLMSLMMQLRKCCNHPFLFPGAEDSIRSGQTWGTACDESIVAASGKLENLDRILPRLQQQGHRAVIFSQFTRFLDILDDYLRWRGYTFVRLDGSTNRVQRTVNIKEFNKKDSQYFLFLMSTRAGGLGVNLQTADTVILMDSDWNPQVDMQAMARCHRIGQKKKVHVYRFVSEGTMEERVLQRAQKKLYLDTMVNRGGSKAVEKFDKMSTKDVLQTLTFGIDRVLAKQGSGSSREKSKDRFLSDRDVDELISRSGAEDDAQKSGDMDDGDRANGDKIDGPTGQGGGASSASARGPKAKQSALRAGQKESVATFEETAPLSKLTLFQGIDYSKFKNASFKDIADAWAEDVRRRGPRESKSRGVLVNGQFVLKQNMYSMEQGEPSVFAKEARRQNSSASSSAVAAMMTASTRQVAGRDFDHMSVCLHCWEGGELICCDFCPAAYHPSCIGIDADEVSSIKWSCPQHACHECGRKAAAVGGTLFRCQMCPTAMCEEHLTLYASDNIANPCHRYVELGQNHPKQACFVICEKECMRLYNGSEKGTNVDKVAALMMSAPDTTAVDEEGTQDAKEETKSTRSVKSTRNTSSPELQVDLSRNLVGASVRKRFPGYGIYDGIVVEKLPNDRYKIDWQDGTSSRMKDANVAKYCTRMPEPSSGGGGAAEAERLEESAEAAASEDSNGSNAMSIDIDESAEQSNLAQAGSGAGSGTGAGSAGNNRAPMPLQPKSADPAEQQQDTSAAPEATPAPSSPSPEAKAVASDIADENARKMRLLRRPLSFERVAISCRTPNNAIQKWLGRAVESGLPPFALGHLEGFRTRCESLRRATLDRLQLLLLQRVEPSTEAAIDALCAWTGGWDDSQEEPRGGKDGVVDGKDNGKPDRNDNGKPDRERAIRRRSVADAYLRLVRSLQNAGTSRERGFPVYMLKEIGTLCGLRATNASGVTKPLAQATMPAQQRQEILSMFLAFPVPGEHRVLPSAFFVDSMDSDSDDDMAHQSARKGLFDELHSFIAMRKAVVAEMRACDPSLSRKALSEELDVDLDALTAWFTAQDETDFDANNMVVGEVAAGWMFSQRRKGIEAYLFRARSQMRLAKMEALPQSGRKFDSQRALSTAVRRTDRETYLAQRSTSCERIFRYIARISEVGDANPEWLFQATEAVGAELVKMGWSLVRKLSTNDSNSASTNVSTERSSGGFAHATVAAASTATPTATASGPAVSSLDASAAESAPRDTGAAQTQTATQTQTVTQAQNEAKAQAGDPRARRGKIVQYRAPDGSQHDELSSVRSWLKKQQLPLSQAVANQREAHQEWAEDQMRQHNERLAAAQNELKSIQEATIAKRHIWKNELLSRGWKLMDTWLVEGQSRVVSDPVVREMDEEITQMLVSPYQCILFPNDQIRHARLTARDVGRLRRALRSARDAQQRRAEAERRAKQEAAQRADAEKAGLEARRREALEKLWALYKLGVEIRAVRYRRGQWAGKIILSYRYAPPGKPNAAVRSDELDRVFNAAQGGSGHRLKKLQDRRRILRGRRNRILAEIARLRQRARERQGSAVRAEAKQLLLHFGKRVYKVEPNTLLHIGRHPKLNDIVLESASVSRKHCKVAGGRIFDLKSKAGVFVNGERVRGSNGRRLWPGDRITVHRFGIQVTADAGAQGQPSTGTDPGVLDPGVAARIRREEENLAKANKTLDEVNEEGNKIQSSFAKLVSDVPPEEADLLERLQLDLPNARGLTFQLVGERLIADETVALLL